jgi:hypothetical protein
MSEASSSSETEPVKISPAVKFLGTCILFAGMGGDNLGTGIETTEKLAALFTQTQSDPAILLQWAREHVQIEMKWDEGARHITGELRSERAERKLLKLLDDPRASRFREKGLNCVVHNDERDLDIYITRRPADWKKRGFTFHYSYLSTGR